MSKFLLTAFILALAALNPASAKGRETVLVLGDSLSAAYGVAMDSGWVTLLERHLAEIDRPVVLVNASISGETTQGGLARLPDLLARHTPGLVIIELGANDGLRGFPLHLIRANLEQMIQMSKQAGARVLLLGMRIPTNYGSKYTSAFYDIYQQLAQQENTGLVPFLLDGIATEDTMMQDDGLHPNASAQPAILRNVLPVLLQLLAEPAPTVETRP
jgi:acyl-CoA thioesterase-1